MDIFHIMEKTAAGIHHAGFDNRPLFRFQISDIRIDHFDFELLLAVPILDNDGIMVTLPGRKIGDNIEPPQADVPDDKFLFILETTGNFILQIK